MNERGFFGWRRKERDKAETTGSIGDRVKAILSKEGIESPPLQIHVSLIEHGTRQDALNLKPELDKCDIFVPEFVSSKSTFKALNKLSRGEISITETRRRMVSDALDPILGSLLAWLGFGSSNFMQFEAGILEIIDRSNKHITNVDIPSTHRIAEVLNYAHEYLSHAIHVIRTDRKLSFDNARKLLLSAESVAGSAHADREQYMINNLADEVAIIIKKDKKLQKFARKTPIRIFMFLGAHHENVPAMLKGLGDSVTSSVAENVLHNDPSGVVSRKAMRREKAVDHEVDAYVLEVVIGRLFTVAEQTFKKKLNLGKNRRVIGDLAAVFARIYVNDAQKIYESYQSRCLGGTIFNRDEARLMLWELYLAREEDINKAMNLLPVR